MLADTERLHSPRSGRRSATRGWTLSERDYFERYLGFDDAALVSEFARDQQIALAAPAQAALVRRKAEVFQSRLTAADVLYPGAPAAIARLGARYRLAIASGSLAVEIRTVLAAAGLSQAFAAIVGADDVRAIEAGARSVPRGRACPRRAAVRGRGDRGFALGPRVGARGGPADDRPHDELRAEALGGADLVLDSLDEVTVDAGRAPARAH